MVRRHVAMLFALGLVVISCGGNDTSPSTDIKTTAETSSETTAAEEVTTTLNPARQPATSTVSDAAREHWEVVVFGDSFASKSGWPAQFAEIVAVEFGVAVSVGGDVCFGGCTALEKIRRSDALQSEIAAAEFIAIQPQPGRVVAPLWRSYSSGDCGGDDGLTCFRQAESDFLLYVEELFDELIMLSEPGTVIRAMLATGTWAIDSFHPGLRETAPDQFDAFLENMLVLSDHIAQAAAHRCILVVDVNAIMSGPDYRQPVTAAYSNDGSHPSVEGSRVIAEALGSLGYQGTVGSC